MDIKIKIVPNPLYGRPGSLVESPYVAQVVHTGTVTAADICEACKRENPQMTEPLAALATETIMDYGSDKVVADVVRFNLGSAFFTMEPAVSGSVLTVDAPLSDENERYIKVVNGQSLNARIAALRPVIVNDDLGDVMFHSTEATHDGEEFKNTLFAGEEFVALGKRLGGEGQTMELVDMTGAVKSEATFVSGDALGQRFAYKLATPPAEDFDGKLVLTSTGKDTPDAAPKTIPVKVSYRHGPFPIVQSASGDIKIMSIDAVGTEAPWAIHGLNVGLTSDDEPNGIVDAVATVGGKTLNWANDATSFEAETAYFSPAGSGDLPPAGEYVADLTFHRAGGSEGGENLVVHDVTITVSEP